MERVTVAEAARRLSVTPEAIRQRVRRGTIEHDKAEDGRLYVYLDPDVTPREGVGEGVGHAVLLDYVETLKGRIRNLEEESRRKDHLLAAALERIPAIEPPEEVPSDAREAPVTPSEEDGKGEGPEDGARRSWWRRLFG